MNKKKKLRLHKETIKNLTLNDTDLAAVVGGRLDPGPYAYTGGSTVNCPSQVTCASCASCQPTCQQCTDITLTSATMNPSPY